LNFFENTKRSFGEGSEIKKDLSRAAAS
jgi:hypothetical protein